MGEVLYHASHCGIHGDIKPISRQNCDFGMGFYLSNRQNQTLGLVLNDAKPRKYEITFIPEKRMI